MNRKWHAFDRRFLGNGSAFVINQKQIKMHTLTQIPYRALTSFYLAAITGNLDFNLGAAHLSTNGMRMSPGLDGLGL